MTDIKEAHGLKVVAWQDAENQLYTTGEKRQMHGWATDGYPIVELVRLSDATAVIDQLREQINDPDFPPKYSRRLIAQLRERVAELEASPLMSPEEARAGIALQLKEIERLRTELAELKSAPVVMPERKKLPELMMATYHESHGWNACLDEFARLNGGKP